MINIDETKSKDTFKRLQPGRHIARIVSVQIEFKEYLRGRSGSDGNAVTFVYETCGNPDGTQNNKKVFQSAPINGENVFILKKIIQSVLPDYDGGSFDESRIIDKYVEIELKYGFDAKTQSERKYPNVSKVYPYFQEGDAGKPMMYEDFKTPQAKYTEGDIPF